MREWDIFTKHPIIREIYKYVNISHLKYTFNRVSKGEYILNFSPACYFTFWIGQKALK